MAARAGERAIESVQEAIAMIAPPDAALAEARAGAARP